MGAPVAGTTYYVSESGLLLEQTKVTTTNPGPGNYLFAVQFNQIADNTPGGPTAQLLDVATTVSLGQPWYFNFPSLAVTLSDNTFTQPTGPNLVLNSDYGASEIPVPAGVGIYGAKVSITK